MKRINIDELKKAIDNSEAFDDVVTKMVYDHYNNIFYLDLKCINEVSGDYTTFASIYEDGLLAMMFGAVNVLEVMDNTEEYHDPETGNILSEYDNYETIIDIIVYTVKQDIEDGRYFLDDILICIKSYEAE